MSSFGALNKYAQLINLLPCHNVDILEPKPDYFEYQYQHSAWQPVYQSCHLLLF